MGTVFDKPNSGSDSFDGQSVQTVIARILWLAVHAQVARTGVPFFVIREALELAPDDASVSVVRDPVTANYIVTANSATNPFKPTL